MPDTISEKKNKFFEFLKDYIALAIVIFSFVVVIILVSSAFNYVNNSQDANGTMFGRVKDIIGFFLPIIGTWMGTILAFYFSKENFESASRSLRETIKSLTSEEKLKSTKVAEVMIDAGKIDKYILKDGETWDSVPVVNYIDFLDSAKRNRLVVFENENTAKYVIHKSTLNDYVYRKYKSGSSKEEVEKLTLKDLISEEKLIINNTVSFINESATLFEAQQKMTANPFCSDVFVTRAGTNNEPTRGWVTNVIVAENAKV